MPSEDADQVGSFIPDPEMDLVRHEAYSLILKMCFDEDLPYVSGHALIQMSVNLFPECYDRGLQYWWERFSRLGKSNGINPILEIMREWIFTVDGIRFSDTQDRIVTMSAIITINAIRNRLWTFLSKRGRTTHGITDKYQLMRTAINYICYQHGTNINALLHEPDRDIKKL